MRKICSAGKDFVAHGSCLSRLRQLACELNGKTPPIPTLLRPLTLNEFLLAKRPRTSVEILLCIAYYHQALNDTSFVLTVSLVQSNLEYSAFKIDDIPSALQDATDKLAYFTCRKSNNLEKYSLTEKGRRVVVSLP